jgi:hypothetical protein
MVQGRCIVSVFKERTIHLVVRPGVGPPRAVLRAALPLHQQPGLRVSHLDGYVGSSLAALPLHTSNGYDKVEARVS